MDLRPLVAALDKKYKWCLLEESDATLEKLRNSLEFVRDHWPADEFFCSGKWAQTRCKNCEMVIFPCDTCIRRVSQVNIVYSCVFNPQNLTWAPEGEEFSPYNQSFNDLRAFVEIYTGKTQLIEIIRVHDDPNLPPLPPLPTPRLMPFDRPNTNEKWVRLLTRTFGNLEEDHTKLIIEQTQHKSIEKFLEKFLAL